MVNLTPYGKITIIKSLLISKVTHDLLSLPSLSLTTFNLLEDMFKKFLWNNKIPKFRKDIIENLTNLGGLKMVNLRTFDMSLKLSWIKIISLQREGWAEFPIQMGIHKIIEYGDLYAKRIINKISNKFSKNLVEGIIQFMGKFKIKNTIQLQWMPLWYNSNLNFEYRKDWERKG